MRYRPWSSVTTILANFVGRSEVSAITHTPASGPLAPVTPPDMSSRSIVVVPPEARPALQAAQTSAETATVATAKSAFVVFICQPLDDVRPLTVVTVDDERRGGLVSQPSPRAEVSSANAVAIPSRGHGCPAPHAIRMLTADQ